LIGGAAQEPRGRLLGIDHGTKMIGLAICDAMWIAPRPLEVIMRQNRTADFAYINSVIASQNIAAVVVGLPELPEVREDVEVINQADTVRRWVSRLAAAVEVPVYLWDEQYSSFEAESLGGELGRQHSDRIDDIAAALILQSFIAAHPTGTALPRPVKLR
jgi:putative holliday junction resolvase